MRVFAFLNVDDPSVAWLVYRGVMVSAGAMTEQEHKVISIWHAKYLFDAAGPKERAARYEAESEIERERVSSYPDRVSRLSGLYFFEDAESALRAGERWDAKFREEYLAEIELVGQPKVARYDSEWITRRMDSDDRSWIPRYLAGEPLGPSPVWELLVEGRGFVLGTRLRRRAYETVKRQWPRSLGLLDLSRVAAELDSDLGLSVPLLWRDRDLARLAWCILVEDLKNREFLDKLRAYEGPWNIAGPVPPPDLVLPDTSGTAVAFKVST
jgi:hypothetical protein